MGGARKYGDGSDVAIVTWGVMVKKALEAAALLAEMGINATVLDLRWLRPLDVTAIDNVVRVSGGRILIAHEDVVSGGFGAEVAAQIHERHHGGLAAPVMRLGSMDIRMPSAPALQEAAIPQVADLVKAAASLAETAQGMQARTDV